MSRSNNFATSGTDLATIQLSQKLNKRKRDKERVKRGRRKELRERERERERRKELRERESTLQRRKEKCSQLSEQID